MLRPLVLYNANGGCPVGTNMRVRPTLTVGVLAILSMSGLVSIVQVQAQICSVSQSPAWRICGPIESSGTVNIQPIVVQSLHVMLNLSITCRSSSMSVIFITSGGWNVI